MIVSIGVQFCVRYASTVMDIYKINEELNAHLADIAQFTPQFGDESGPSLSLPTVIREGCHEDSYDMVNKYNSQVRAEWQIEMF